MKRRECITLAGGVVAAWPLVVRAQQTAMPVIGFLSSLSAESSTASGVVTSFKNGLGESGFVEGQSVTIEYRFANNRLNQLPALAADLVSRHVNVIATIGSESSTAAALATTSSIPIVFALGSDPVRDGFIPNIKRPGGNVTGITFFFAEELSAKRLEWLREMAPKATRIGLLNDPASPNQLDDTMAPGAQLLTIEAGSGTEIEAAFKRFAQEHVDALYVGRSPLFLELRDRIVTLVADLAVPACYPLRGLVDGGGLMSYGASATDANRQAGIYVGKILKGEKPGDLPVLQPTTFELVINLKTAKTLGLTVPQTLLVAATDVIE